MKRRHWVLLLLLALIAGIRHIPHAGEWYATRLYPSLSAALSLLASPFPFSLDEWVVILSILLLLTLPFILARRMKARRILLLEVEIGAWLYAWFYLGWACNYSRDNLLTRLGAQPKAYDETAFKAFLSNYTDSLNYYALLRDTCYLPIPEHVEAEVKSLYRQIAPSARLCTPHDFQHPKQVTFNRVYSGVGVLGYMGPFAAESHLNRQLLPDQYPFVYAHELSHLLSVSNEAEANFWAFTVCTHSSEPHLRYCGYYGILPNVWRNAAALLPADDFEQWKASLSPSVRQQISHQSHYWSQLRSPFLDDVQSSLYNLFLKSNNISSGTKNYDQVVSLIITLSPQ